MKDPYSVLGVSEKASDEEIKTAYRTLARKYHPDNYTDDNPLKDLADEKMKEINAAYDEIQKIRSGQSSYQGSGTYYQSNGQSGGQNYYSGDPIYANIRNLINSHRYADAERALGDIYEGDRSAEWHYLQSLVLMRRRLINDAMRELEIACTMDPSNEEYQRAKEMFNTNTRGYGNNYYAGNPMGNRMTDRDICNCCSDLICMDCLCECLGGDLIPCL